MPETFLKTFRTPVSQLESVELKDLPAPEDAPSLHTETFVEMEEFSGQRVRATVTFRAWTEPRGIIDFRSTWTVKTMPRGELPTREEFERLIQEFVYSAATRNSLLLAFLSSQMTSDGAGLVLSVPAWLDHIIGVSWKAME